MATKPTKIQVTDVEYEDAGGTYDIPIERKEVIGSITVGLHGTMEPVAAAMGIITEYLLANPNESMRLEFALRGTTYTLTVEG